MKCDYKQLENETKNLNEKLNHIMNNLDEITDILYAIGTEDSYSSTINYFKERYKTMATNIDNLHSKTEQTITYLENVVENYEKLDSAS